MCVYGTIADFCNLDQRTCIGIERFDPGLMWNQTILWTLFILTLVFKLHSFHMAINWNVTHEYLEFWIFVPLTKMHKNSPSDLFHIYTVPLTKFTILMFCLEHCVCFDQAKQ